MERKPIKVSTLLEFLEEGLTRPMIAEKLGITTVQVAKLFKHPQLKGRKAKSINPYKLVDDVTPDNISNNIDNVNLDNSGVNDSNTNFVDPISTPEATDFVPPNAVPNGMNLAENTIEEESEEEGIPTWDN